MQEIHYEAYEQWIQNFALNLNSIWSGHSANELSNVLRNNRGKLSSAIIIGRGPSLKKHNHLKILADSNYRGNIICCDGALINSLKEGITPDKFPRFYVTSIEPYKRIEKYLDDEIVRRYGEKISIILPSIADPNVVEIARNAKMKIFWMHLLFDYNEGKKSFNYISAHMVRAKNHINGLPAIQTGANVGTASWFVGWKIMKIPTICIIGINHGWEDDDPIEKILSHGYENKHKSISVNSKNIARFTKRIYNPDFQCYCIQDPIYYFYSQIFKEFITRSPTWVKTINATEGGSIFGTRIYSMKLKDFLKQYKN